MDNKQKSLNLLGLANRAGQLQSGQPLVLNAVRNRGAKAVIVAEDASENTQKQIKNKCDYYGVPIYKKFNKNELSAAIGKERTVCAILDSGFAESFKKLQ